MRQTGDSLLQPAETRGPGGRAPKAGSVPPVQVVVVLEAFPFFLSEQWAKVRVADGNRFVGAHFHLALVDACSGTHKVSDVVKAQIVAVELALQPIFSLGKEDGLPFGELLVGSRVVARVICALLSANCSFAKTHTVVGRKGAVEAGRLDHDLQVKSTSAQSSSNALVLHGDPEEARGKVLGRS